MYVSDAPTKIIIYDVVISWFLFIFSFPPFSITVFREHIVVIILIFFIDVFHHNPSFSVLGPTIVASHETFLKQVAVNGFPDRVRLLALTVNTWTPNKAIIFVRLSHIEKISQARNKLGSASFTVHPLPVHLHHIIKYILETI